MKRIESESDAEEGKTAKRAYRKKMHVQLQEAVINMNEWYEKMHPEWKKWRIIKEICMSCKLNTITVRRTINHYIKYGTYREFECKGRKPSFVCSDEDRDILDKCIHKLKDENRLNGVNDVYKEMKTSPEFNPSFKGCGRQTFYKIFNQSGFKITETTIVNKKPERKVSKEKNAEGLWQCVWPECGKVFNNSTDLVVHTRTHTQEKPYACRQAGCTYKCSTPGKFQKHLKVHNICVTKNLSVERQDSN